MRRLSLCPLVLAACAGAPPKQQPPEPEVAPREAGVIVYADDDVKTHRWVDLATQERGEVDLSVAVLAGVAPDGAAAWVSGFDRAQPDVMFLAKLTRAKHGVTLDVVDQRPTPRWPGGSIVHRTVTGVRAVSPAGDEELMVCPDIPMQTCIRPLAVDEPFRPVAHRFANPSYGEWTAGGPIVFDAGDAGIEIVTIDPATGAAKDAGTVDSWSIPTVSPDGLTIAWFDAGDADRKAALRARAVADVDITPITIELPGASTIGTCGFVGEALVVCSTGQTGWGSRLFAIDLDRREARLLSDELGQPMWVAAPGGDQIAFSRMSAPIDEDGMPRLAIVPTAGGEPQWVDGPGDTIQYAVAWVRSPR